MEKLLGVPERMFDNEQVYVISELAQVGRTYGFVCPTCHAYFDITVDKEKHMKVKCPECETYICFSSIVGETPQKRRITSHRGTQVSPRRQLLKSRGMLKWSFNGELQYKELRQGAYIIGRQDSMEPSDLSLSDPTASRRSVKLEVLKGEKSGNYSFKLTVLKTTNAVFVNNNMLYTNDCVYLSYGDVLKVGNTTLLFDKIN